MHMPKRMGMVVFTVVALCLGAYYVLVLREPDLGDWRVYQGRGELVREDDSTFVDIRYTVKHPDRPLFAYVSLEAPARPDADTAFVLRYRSEGPAALVVHVREEDGSSWQAARVMAPSAQWAVAHFRPPDFSLEPAPGNVDENGRVDFDQLRSRVDFLAGSATPVPTIAVVNRLEIAAPAFVQERPEIKLPPS
jgi:hypothetical protein